MGSTHLGSQNTTPTATCASSGCGSSKPQNILATKNKPKPPPTLKQNNGNSTQTNPTRTVWSAAKERGQAILRTGKSPAKRHPHITTISTTRSNNSNSATPTRTGGGTHKPAPLILSPPQTIITTTTTTKITTTNPSIHHTPPSPPPTRATTIATTRSQSPSRPRPHTPQPPPFLPLTARRPPLHLQDHNVAPALKENKKMGYETSLDPSTTTSARPPMPALSSTATRSLNRMPLTPKIASAPRPPQPQTPAVAAATSTTTPLPRRTQPRPVSTTAVPNGSNRAPYDDPGTISAAPFSPLLNSNVTPRSGSRQSRVDSASSTPNGTPIHDRSDAWESRPAFPFSSPSNQGDLSRRPLVAFNAVSPERNVPLRQDTTNPRVSKFFHASDAKTTRPTSASKMASPKNPTFFYANGNGIAPRPPSPTTLSPPLSPGLNRSQENVSSKFMYANGTPEVRPTPPPMLSRASAPTVPTASKSPTVRSPVAFQRPVSPSKLPLHSQSSYRNSTGSHSATMGAAAAPTARAQVSPPPPLAPSTPGLRCTGTATSRSSGHSRSASLAKGEGAPETLKPITSPTIGLFPPANLTPSNPPPLTLASIIQAAEEFTEHENEALPDDQTVLQSPTKSNVPSPDPVTELIANARRERKVQDLQIRNASLEAINRTLERQLRRQTTELRRFQRLSRSGQLSLASTTMSSRVPSGTMSELELEPVGLEPVGLSDLSEEDLSIQEVEDESLSDTDSVSSDLSPSILAARDAKHRERDEERLNLDLSKHQQILIDSQKINQSIKRCLDWTEELINDGKKALEYKVRVSDVRLGGRVLGPLDEEEENATLLLSNDTVALDTKPIEEVLQETLTSWGIEPQDRDSGIELPRDGE
ncbi:hypothetical protein F4824DRAFT_496868 [Ustulina deusta]|nr:hypothetical protein F4824DRAFT_496868 [Ustulina deusta]